jgi:cytochrome c oxidase subunit 2
VPVNQPVIVEITSQDVNHSFYIPAFRIKADAINGHVNKLWFEATQAGSYDVACAEYCGLSHAYMYTKVVALPPAEYAQWYAIDEE